MRSLARLVALCAALTSLLVPAALADKPEKPGKPGAPAGSTDAPGQAGDKDKPAKDKPAKDKPAKGEQEQTDRPQLPSEPPPVPVTPPQHPEHTELGETVAAAATSGTVKVKLPGQDEFVDLAAGAIPVGASIDATRGLAEIGSATANGGEQHAVVTGSVFRVEQSAAEGGVTDLVLEGGDFDACDPPARGRTARAAAKGKARGTVVRGLWAAGKGKFRTRGRKSVASVRGTRWATVERCHSTTVRVFDGIVDVKDLLTGRTVTLRAGERHVATTLGPKR